MDSMTMTMIFQLKIQYKPFHQHIQIYFFHQRIQIYFYHQLIFHLTSRIKCAMSLSPRSRSVEERRERSTPLNFSDSFWTFGHLVILNNNTLKPNLDKSTTTNNKHSHVNYNTLKPNLDTYINETNNETTNTHNVNYNIN